MPCLPGSGAFHPGFHGGTPRANVSAKIPRYFDWADDEVVVHVQNDTDHITNYRVLPAPKNRPRLWTYQVSCRLALAMAPRWLEIAVPTAPKACRGSDEAEGSTGQVPPEASLKQVY